MGALADHRARVAAALEPLDAEWSVHPAAVDALTPPAFVLVWVDDPRWLSRSTACAYGARLDVVCVAGRLDPAPGIETLETMVEAAVAALDAAAVPATDVAAPAPFEAGGVRYLAARLLLRTPVTIGGP
jgi:hypothetical protein